MGSVPTKCAESNGGEKMNMREIAFILVALIAQALSAACNPEPVEIKCSRHEAKSCGGVIAPSYGKVLTQANCTNFIFTLQNVTVGKETVFINEVYTGNGSGSADYAPGQIMTFFKHKKLDMDPADWAKALDGGVWGPCSEAYLLRRPEKGAEKCPRNP